MMFSNLPAQLHLLTEPWIRPAFLGPTPFARAAAAMGPKASAGELSTGEKSAITRAVREGREIKFTQEHPEKKAAAEAYAAEVRSKGKEGGGSGPSSPRGKKK